MGNHASQSQGSVVCANEDMENMIATGIETNQTKKKWSEYLRFVQAMKTAYRQVFTL
jgi:hypothetical protein